MRIEQYRADFQQSVVEFWNRNLQETFPMSGRLWEQNISPTYGFLPEGSWVALADGEIVGLIANKYIPLKMGEADLATTGWVNSLLVDQDYRGRGIGSELYQRTEALFSSKGVRRISLGAELGHFFPGVPVESSELANFVLKHGFTGGAAVCDLTCKRRNFLTPTEEVRPEVAREIEIFLAAEQDYPEAQEFYLKYFPGRWEYEFRQAWADGVLDGLVLLKVKGVVKGFAKIYDAQSKYIGPNIYWGELLARPYGGLGPIGVARDERGKGLGMELLYRSLLLLWERDVQEICIDFTNLVDFYGKLGFKPWKEYLRYVKEL